MANKVRFCQPLLGEANAAGYLIAVPGASVLIRQAGVACTVYSSTAGAAMTNPVPTGVSPGTAGVDTLGTLLVYLDAGRGYDGVATVGAASSTFALPDISPDVADVFGPGASVVGAATSTVLGALKVTGDVTDRFRLLANGEQVWRNATTGATINYLKMANSGHLEMKGLKLRDDASAASAPELHFHAANASGPDDLAWLVGIDIAQPTTPSTNQAPARDFIIGKVPTGGGSIDAFHGKHRGGDLVPIWAFGNASCWETVSESYILTVNPTLNEAAMGGLLILVPTANTTPAFNIQDSGGTRRIYADGNNGSLYLRGEHALTGAAIAIKANSLNGGVLAFSDSAGANLFELSYGPAADTSLKIRSISTGNTLIELYPAAVRVQLAFSCVAAASIGGAAGTLGFYASAGVAKQTGVAVTAAGIHAALVALNLIAA